MQLCGSLSILWHCLSLGLERKLTFSSPVGTAEFSKFAGILSAALLQHQLLGFDFFVVMDNINQIRRENDWKKRTFITKDELKDQLGK